MVFNSYNKIECLHKIKGNLIMAYSEKTLIIMKYIEYFSKDEKERLLTMVTNN